MPGYSLVPVDYQPDFDGYSLVPVDYDPFAADGPAQQAQIQQAQAEPQGPPQRPPATGAGQPHASAPAAGSDGAAPNLTLDQGAAKDAPFGGYANPTPTAPPTSNGVLAPLSDENDMVDSYVYKKIFHWHSTSGPSGYCCRE
jgi:hypothetical protein